MNRRFYPFFKRLFDIVGAAFGLVVLSPVLLCVAIMVKKKLGSPVIFKQTRAGYKGKPFTIYKFRTMTDERDEEGNLLPDEKRLTKFGAFLRSTSLDELPELYNVLKGDMSLVGPRPLFVEYLPYYTERERKRHNVRPGITGLAQVNGRNLTIWDERLEIDAEYVENMSLLLDIKILFKTVFSVLLRQNVAVVPGSLQSKLSVYRSECSKSKKETGFVMKLLTKGDLPKRVELFNQPEVFKMMGFKEKLTLEKTREWFEKKATDTTRADFVFFHEEEAIGMGGLIHIDKHNKNAELYIAIKPEYQGKGYGKKGTFSLCSFGFEELELNRIYLFTDEDNIKASKLYEQVGFCCEGLLREHVFKQGQFKDRRIYGLLRKDWNMANRSRYGANA